MPASTTRPVVVAGGTLGVGLGGFVDGILLHQLVQWHHMVTAVHPARTLADLELNTLADGIFHGATWSATVVGLVLLWRAARMPGVEWAPRLVFGGLLIGWGSFNVIEGVIDHHILGLHHVRDDLGGPLAWDLGFLAFGALLIATGWTLLHRSDVRPPVA